jgi:site-specific DNA-methyltransferase (adenine-specific)
LVELHNADCLEAMKDIPDGSVDMVMADPPYGTTQCKWDSIIPLDEMWAHLKRIVKPRGAIVMTASQPFTSALVMSNPDWFKYAWVWHKNRATGHVHAKNKPMKQHEDVCVFSEGTTVHASQSVNRMPYFPQGLVELPKGTKRRTRNDAGDNAVMAHRKSHRETECTHTGYPISIVEFAVDVNNGHRVHPTQKPVALMEYLIKTYTNEGETVLDFCMGSGTTGVAAKNLGRDFIGIEMDAEYFKIAQERIDQPCALF